MKCEKKEQIESKGWGKEIAENNDIAEVKGSKRSRPGPRHKHEHF